MKKIFLFLAALSSFAFCLHASPKEATVLEIRNDVRLRNEGKQDRQARVKDLIKEGDMLLTKKKSRAEIELSDKTIVRLGANTIFSFDSERRNLLIEQGEGLFAVPKGLKGTRVSTPAATAAILGTTVYLKVAKKSTDYLCLEGKCQIGPHLLAPGDRITLPPRSGYDTPVSRFDIKDFLKSNSLITDFQNPLPSLKLIEEEADKISRPSP